MPVENFEVVGSFNNQRVIPLDPERTVNMFEYLDPLGKKSKSLLCTSGLDVPITFDTTPSGASRATFVFQGVNEAQPHMYQVFGFDVYRIDIFFAHTLIFSFTSSTDIGYVGVDANSTEVIFVDGQEGWIWDTGTNTATQIIDANFPTRPIDVCSLDGFFVVANGDTNEFRLSQFDDGLNWTPLQQGTITSHPGNIVACRTLHRKLFLFSNNYIEVWENQGIGANLPFRRINSLLLEYGTPAIGSIATGFDMMLFLSQDRDGLGSVMMVTGTQAIPVSTRAIDFIFAGYAELEQITDARAFLIKENGLIFYRLNFTAANHTWVYNVTLSDPQSEASRLWHEEEVLNGNRHPAQTHGYFIGNNYVGDYIDPVLYKVDTHLFTNAGEAIRRMRITRSFVPPDYRRLRIDRFQLDLLQGSPEGENQEVLPIELFTETGVVILTEDAREILLQQGHSEQAVPTPVVFLSISKDGGQTFGYLQPAPMGAVGQRSFRTLWRKLGTIPRGQGFVAKIEFFDAYPFSILGAAWAMEVLPE